MVTRRQLSRRAALGLGAAAVIAVPARSALATPGRRRAGDVPPMDVLWSTDFADGWAGWLDTPWNDEPQGEVPRPVIVPSPTGSGQCGRFHLAGGQKRNESQPDAAQSIQEGDTLIVRFVDVLDAGFPVDTDDWQVVLQFKNDGEGSPPCEIKIGHGQYYLDGNGGAWHHDIGPATAGEPIDVAVRIVFSADPTASTMDAWHNGVQTLTGALPEGAGTLYEGLGSYLKTGLYRSTGISDTGTRFLTSLAIGTPN